MTDVLVTAGQEFLREKEHPSKKPRGGSSWGCLMNRKISGWGGQRMKREGERRRQEKMGRARLVTLEAIRRSLGFILKEVESTGELERYKP